MSRPEDEVPAGQAPSGPVMSNGTPPAFDPDPECVVSVTASGAPRNRSAS